MLPSSLTKSKLHKLSKLKINMITQCTIIWFSGCQSTRTLAKSYHANSYPSQLVPNINPYPDQLVPTANSCPNHLVPNTNSYPNSLFKVPNVANGAGVDAGISAQLRWWRNERRRRKWKKHVCAGRASITLHWWEHKIPNCSDWFDNALAHSDVQFVCRQFSQVRRWAKPEDFSIICVKLESFCRTPGTDMSDTVFNTRDHNGTSAGLPQHKRCMSSANRWWQVMLKKVKLAHLI